MAGDSNSHRYCLWRSGKFAWVLAAVMFVFGWMDVATLLHWLPPAPARTGPNYVMIAALVGAIIMCVSLWRDFTCVIERVILASMLVAMLLHLASLYKAGLQTTNSIVSAIVYFVCGSLCVVAGLASVLSLQKGPNPPRKNPSNRRN